MYLIVNMFLVYPLAIYTSISRTKVYTYILYAYTGTKLLDSSYQIPLLVTDIQSAINKLTLDRSYTVITEASITTARNLRHSFSLSVASRVVVEDVNIFQAKLLELWRMSLQGFIIF